MNADSVHVTNCTPYIVCLIITCFTSLFYKLQGKLRPWSQSCDTPCCPDLLTLPADHELTETRKPGCFNQSEKCIMYTMALLFCATSPINGQLLVDFAFKNVAPPSLRFIPEAGSPWSVNHSEQNCLFSQKGLLKFSLTGGWLQTSNLKVGI